MKINLTVLIALFVFAQVHAQDYKLTFSLEGEVNSIDSVIVENATQNTRIKLNGNDTLFLTKRETGISTLQKSESFRLKAFPNPSSTLFNLQFTTGKAENIVARIFDIEGRDFFLQKFTVIQGVHTFQVKNLPTGIFIVQLNSGSESEQIKIVKLQGSNSQTEISEIYSEQLQDIGLRTKSAADARLMGYEVYDNITVRVWPASAPWELTRGFVMTDEEPLTAEKHTFVFEYVKCEDKCGNVYNTVQIGNQIWMAENLKCPTEKSWTYENNPNNAEKYGLLYTWEDAMNNAPEGWHLPTHEEWLEMEENVRITYNDKVPFALKSKVGWLPDENQNSTNGTDASGFNIIPGGARWFYDGSFYASGESAYFWTASRKDSIRSTIRKITKSDTAIGAGYSNINYGFSVRYVKDKIENSNNITINGKLDESLLSLINVEELQIRSISDSSKLSTQGEFEIRNYQLDGGEQPPILFSKDGQLVLGFYPDNTNGNVISVDDILLFFFLQSPDIRLANADNSTILEQIKNDVNHQYLHDCIINSLENISDLFKKEDFILKMNESSLRISNELISKTKSANVLPIPIDADFEFSFSRDGSIKWDNSTSLNAAIGFDIKDESNKTVFGPQIIYPSGYIFSPTSTFSWLVDYFFPDLSVQDYTETNLKTEGHYIISISNGNNSDFGELRSFVRDYNEDAFIWDAAFIVIPKVFFELVDKDCVESVFGALTTWASQ